jgi:hypothetical protein
MKDFYTVKYNDLGGHDKTVDYFAENPYEAALMAQSEVYGYVIQVYDKWGNLVYDRTKI